MHSFALLLADPAQLHLPDIQFDYGARALNVIVVATAEHAAARPVAANPLGFTVGTPIPLPTSPGATGLFGSSSPFARSAVLQTPALAISSPNGGPQVPRRERAAQRG